MQDAKGRGRRAYQQRAWGDAYDALSQASAAGPLNADDVECLAWSAILTGRDELALEAFERLHQLRLDAGEDHRAARAALWLALRATSAYVASIQLYARERSNFWELAPSFLPSVVFLDIGMPDMDGYEVARRLRRLPGGEQALLIRRGGLRTRRGSTTRRRLGLRSTRHEAAQSENVAITDRAAGRRRTGRLGAAARCLPWQERPPSTFS